MNEATRIIISALNQTRTPYNDKLTVAIGLGRTKKAFSDIAAGLGILTDLLDALKTEKTTFHDWLFAVGITVYDEQETFYSIELEVAAPEGVDAALVEYKLFAEPKGEVNFRFVGTKPNLLAYLKNCYGEGEVFLTKMQWK